MQSVHDALQWNASQRPAAERDVEALAREVERFCVVNGEADAAVLLARQRRPGDSDVLRARIEGIDRRGVARGERGHAAFATADVKHPLTIERDDSSDRSHLDPVFVTSLHELRLCTSYGRAASTELCLAP